MNVSTMENMQFSSCSCIQTVIFTLHGYSNAFVQSKTLVSANTTPFLKSMQHVETQLKSSVTQILETMYMGLNHFAKLKYTGNL